MVDLCFYVLKLCPLQHRTIRAFNKPPESLHLPSFTSLFYFCQSPVLNLNVVIMKKHKNDSNIRELSKLIDDLRSHFQKPHYNPDHSLPFLVSLLIQQKGLTLGDLEAQISSSYQDKCRGVNGIYKQHSHLAPDLLTRASWFNSSLDVLHVMTTEEYVFTLTSHQILVFTSGIEINVGHSY